MKGKKKFDFNIKKVKDKICTQKIISTKSQLGIKGGANPWLEQY